MKKKIRQIQYDMFHGAGADLLKKNVPAPYCWLIDGSPWKIPKREKGKKNEQNSK